MPRLTRRQPLPVCSDAPVSRGDCLALVSPLLRPNDMYSVVRARRLVMSITVILSGVILTGGAAWAATPLVSPCGTVKAYSAPTPTGAGSIVIGSSTFALAPGSATPASSVNPTPQVQLGAGVCISGTRNAAAAFTEFTVAPMSAMCGVISAFTPATTSTSGSITLGNTAPVTLPIATGVTLSAAQITGNQCFTLAVDAQGTGQVIAYAGSSQGGVAGPSPAATAPLTPGLPNTSTTSDPAISTLIVAAVFVLLVSAGAWTLRGTRQPR